MNFLFILILACVSLTARAEVFKCTDAAGKTIYQFHQCEGAKTARQLDIKSDPKVEAEGKAKLEAIQNQLREEKSQQMEADKEAVQRSQNAAALNALNREALAREQLANEQKRTADELEKQNQILRERQTLPNHIAPMPFPRY